MLPPVLARFSIFRKEVHYWSDLTRASSFTSLQCPSVCQTLKDNDIVRKSFKHYKQNLQEISRRIQWY